MLLVSLGFWYLWNTILWRETKWNPISCIFNMYSIITLSLFCIVLAFSNCACAPSGKNRKNQPKSGSDYQVSGCLPGYPCFGSDEQDTPKARNFDECTLNCDSSSRNFRRHKVYDIVCKRLASKSTFDAVINSMKTRWNFFSRFSF